jgi:hypothetical protein
VEPEEFIQKEQVEEESKYAINRENEDEEENKEIEEEE